MTRDEQPVSIFGVPVTALMAVLVFAAVLAGGATERLPQGIVLAAMGVLMIAAPPAAWPERKWMAVVTGLLAVAAVGFLPGEWFRTAPWRAGVEEAGIVLPSTLSPQPRLTLEAWLLLAAGVAWMGWLMATPWNAESRRLGARCFAGGALLLAVLALVQWKTGWRPAGWLSEEGRGPFPNRNHTAHVLALGGVIAVGCAVDAARRGRMRAVPFLLAGCVVLAGLAAIYSRGGVMMFFFALAIWNATVAWTRQSWKILLLGLTALFVAAAGVLVFGGAIADRFAGGQRVGEDLRLRIWSDASDLMESSPLYGVGLGNFSGVFPFYRTHSVTQSRVIHPESDWLWLGSETGAPGMALGLAAVGVALAGALPLKRGSQRRLRGAALAAAAAAVLHGFMDVPGHRLGSVLAVLFVITLARKDTEPVILSPSAAVVWRALGLAMVALAAWWINFTDEDVRAERLASEGRFAAAVDSASRAIHRAPLDWRAYFTRAGALARSGRLLDAVADFRRARVLEPHYAAVPLEEGRFWIRLQPELAFAAWAEALRRPKGQEAAMVFARMRIEAPDDPAIRARLLELVDGRAPLQMDWFLWAPVAEAKPHLAAFAEIAQLCDKDRRKVFARRAAELEAAARP